MVEAGYSGSYIRGAYTTLSAILRAAAAAKLIGEAPLSGIELPTIGRKRERFLSESEVDRLVDSMTPFYQPLTFTAAWTGLRWGELAGLRRDHLDIERRQLKVRSVLTSIRGDDGRLRLGCKDYPKSDSGRRTIGLPRSVVDLLTGHLRDAPEGEYVFTSRSGALLRASNFRRRHWAPAVKRAGLEPLTFHALRHTHTALLIRYGWQEYNIVRRLGWKDGTMLYRVYGHLFPNHDDDLVLDLERRLQRAREAPGTVLPMPRNG
jgi:integrase